MGLKCSVIGHKYGDAEVEREREEQGSEVVITIQERETCERCGKTRIVSENKEVTAIETPSDIAGDMLDDGDEGADADEETVEADAAAEGGAADDESVTETDEVEPAAGGSDGLDDSGVDAVDPDADDAEILDDEEPAGGDSELENPSTDVSVAEAEESEPALDTEEAAVTSDPEADDGMIIDGDEEDDSVADDRQPGEWPEEPDDDGDDWAPETAASQSAGDEKGAGDGESTVEPFGGNAVTVPNGQFRCPECEFTTDVESSSLRAGDFCPECHKGALVNTAE
jgi:ssDNA-binding Zn-finger/Zn-ribbon topoisomerase 1